MVCYMIFDKQVTLSKENLTLKVLDESHFISMTNLATEKKIWEYAPLPYYQS